MKFDPHEEVVAETGALRALHEAGSRVVLAHEEREISGGEAHEIVQRMAKVLTAHGLTHGSAIAMLSMNLPEAYLAQLAGQHIGARYTPLHPMGSLSDHTLVLGDAEIDCLIYDPRLFAGRAAELREAGAVALTLALGPDVGEPDLIELAAYESPDPTPPAPVRGEETGLLYYTGGTTGSPKGVMHSRFGSWYSMALMGGGPTSHNAAPPRQLICTPISHAGGALIAPTIMRGGSVVLVDKFDPQEFLCVIERRQVTQTFLVPTMIYALLDHLRDHPTIDVSILTEVLYGAAPMSPSRLREGIERIGPVFVQGYGQTEIGVNILRLESADHRLDRPDLLASAGRPTIGVVASIRHEDGAEADPNEVGELCLRGPMVMKGYWKNPELTAHALRGGWLHTDDMGFMDADGFITLVDRRKDMIISGGFNVYPSEVENAISELAQVSSCAVIGVPDERWGEAVKAFVVRHPDAKLTQQQVIDHVRERKGPVQAPKSVEFIAELPKTPLGKLDKKALRAR
ncbi:MAG: AMP-binding protein [Cumulibacter sp.]